MKAAAISSLFLAMTVAGCGDPDAATKEDVRSRLSDPNSAEFRNIKRTGEVTCGEVNSRNKQGGYDGFKPFLINKEQGTVIRPDGELSPDTRKMLGSTLAGPNVDGFAFDQLFRRICPEQ